MYVIPSLLPLVDPSCGWVQVAVQRMYGRMCRDLQRLHGVTKSPLFCRFGHAFHCRRTFRSMGPGALAVLQREAEELIEVNVASKSRGTAQRRTQAAWITE